MTRDSASLLKPAMAAAIVATVLQRTCVNNVDVDIWHQMALAREILSTGRIPHTDTFAYTATVSPLVNHEWGAGIVAYLLAVHIGPAAIIALKYLLIAATAAFCYFCARRRGGPMIAWAPLTIPAIWVAATGYAPVRAQDYTYLAVAALMWCLIRDDEGSRRWIAPWLAVFPVWANLHGGATVAFMLIGAHWLERVVVRKPHWHLVGVGAGMAALLFVNPYGFDYITCLWRALALPRPTISEWQPVWAIGPTLFVPFVLCIGVAAYCLVMAAWRRTGVPFGSAMVIATAVFAARHAKLAPIFAVVFISLVPGWLAATPVPRVTEKLRRNWGDLLPVPWLILLVLMFSGIGMVSGFRLWELKVPSERAGTAERAYPVGAVDYLRDQRFSGNLMTSFENGAYCSWKLYPRVRISLDGRYELVFTEQLLNQTARFFAARPGWQKMLTEYPTDVALIPSDAKVAAVMPASGWRRVYSDSEYELYARPGLVLPVVTCEGPVPEGRLP